MAENGNLVYIRYRDHVLYRRTDAGKMRPQVREAVGWLHKENGEAVWILWDRGISNLPHERVRPEESGLVLLKADVLELRRLEAAV